MQFNRLTNKYENKVYKSPDDKSNPPRLTSARVSDSLKLLQTNIRGLKSKKASLQLIIEEQRPDLVLVSETLLPAAQRPGVKGMSTFYRSREQKKGGGLLTAVSNSIAKAAVQVYSGDAEILVTRLEHTSRPVSVISVYGVQEAKQEEVIKEFDEIVNQMMQAKSRGDLCVVTGDMNRHVGDLIENNDVRISKGGMLWRDFLTKGEFVMVNAMTEKVQGGPFTWHKAGGGAHSALALWIVCSETIPHIEDLVIDDSRSATPFRITGKKPNKRQVFSDHNSTILTLKNLNNFIPRIKTTVWSMKGACWKKYEEESRKAGKTIEEKMNRIEGLEDTERMISKEDEKLHRKCFKKVTIKSGGKESNIAVKDNQEKVKEVKRINKEAFEEEINKIKEKGATVGKIYALKDLVHGKKKKQSQVPAAVQDSETKEMKYEVGEIKTAVKNHVIETLRDRNPLPRHEEMANQRKEVIEAALKVNEEERVEFTEEDLENVVKAMADKNKDCHKQIVKADPSYRKAMLRMFNKCAKEEKIPTAYTETTLTQLKKPKGAMYQLDGYRYIHTKKASPRTMEALMTEKMKPIIYAAVSPYQLGGMKKTRPAEHLYLLKVMMKLYNQEKLPLWLSTFDMKKFFDIQRWDDSAVSLITHGMRGPLLRLYEAVTSTNKMKVITAAGPTEWFSLAHLTPQGSSYGALVSAVNLDTSLTQTMTVIKEFLSSFARVEMRSIIFQDDICKASSSREECQLAQEVIAETVTSKQLVLNEDKCQVMIIGTAAAVKREREQLELEPIMMSGKKVKQAASEKYLGDHVANTTAADSADITIEKRIKSVAGPVAEIIALAADVRSSYIGPISTALILWESIIIKKLLTNSESWLAVTKASVARLERAQLSFLKRLLSLPKATPTIGIWWETGCLPMEWRILLEKMKFVQHLEWKEGENLAAKLWRMEKEEKISGLKEEIEEYIEKYNLPKPTKMMSNVQYRKAIKQAIKEESRNEIRKRLSESTKLRYLVGWDQARAPQMNMTNLKRIRFITRSRLAMHYEFSGDFGSGNKCECGEPDTLSHVRRGCYLFMDILPENYETYNSIEGSEKVYEDILRRKEEIRVAGRAGGVLNGSA